MVQSIILDNINYRIEPSQRGLSCYKYTDGKRGRIPEISSKTLEDIQRYLAAAHMRTLEQVKDVFNEKTDQEVA